MSARPQAVLDLVNLRGEDKPFEIEIEAENILTGTKASDASLKRYDERAIDDMAKRIEVLHELLTFGATRGHTSRS